MVRSEAASWIAQEISRSAIIACDAVMCGNLVNQGLPGSNLLPLSPTASDPLGADVIVSTQALRNEFGARLSSEWAPTVIASFGGGAIQVQVRAVAGSGAAAYLKALNQDIQARKRAGSALIGNRRIDMSPSAKADLVAGLADPRLLLMLPVLARQHPIDVLWLYDKAPGADAGVPLSGVVLAGAVPASRMTGSAYRHWLVGFVLGQRQPYRAVSVAPLLRAGHPIVLVRFSRPAPVGLLH